MESGEVDVVGVNDAIFLACSAINMASEIAKVYIEDIYIGTLEASALGKASVISANLGQKQIGDYTAVAEQEEKGIENAEEQTVSVSRASTMERLLTISLLKLVKFEKIKIAAAGGSINDAVSLALRLTTGKFPKTKSESN